MRFKISLSGTPACISSLKDFPAYLVPFVALNKDLFATVPVFPSSASKLFNCVVACAVGVPCAVMLASDAPTCSKLKLIADAVGVTCANVAPNSPTVVIPLFCVCIITLCTLSVSDTSIL
ncbi:Uncharacterised protein [Clostridioides difficile]|nr:Uncharacterised protein [Clostridioides difficile]VIF36274.1 Uncharacterised protein [Clostridioides difficile]VIF38206.1 Uncharacterised protein [Clostridioides difficile]VIF45455.1 Uncharacterised protein [Clostridioides difficile]